MKTIDALESLMTPGMDIRAKTVWGSIMRELGGADGLAREVKLDLEACEEGSANRIRLLVAVLSGIQKLDTDIDDENKDIDTLKAELRSMLEDDPELLRSVTS